MIISAPPGFGKSTLLAAWIAQSGDEKTAWYSLDEDDNDPARFFGYIAASLQTVEPDSVHQLDSLLDAGSANPRELTVALLNDLPEFSSKSVVLVLDDYHHIMQQPIHDAACLPDRPSPQQHSSCLHQPRGPAAALGRWRVRGQLTEIRADDLRFTEEEVAQFLNQTMGLSSER
jgi:LuxR family maltose regulon positive regulatory protein